MSGGPRGKAAGVGLGAGRPARPGSAVNQTMKPKSRSRRRFASRKTAPPPVATTAVGKPLDQFGEGPFFPVAEDRLAFGREDRAHRPAGACLELEVGIEERAAATGRPRSGLPSTCRSRDSRRVPGPDPGRRGRGRRGVECHSGRSGESLCLRATTITSVGASWPV